MDNEIKYGHRNKKTKQRQTLFTSEPTYKFSPGSGHSRTEIETSLIDCLTIASVHLQLFLEPPEWG